MVGVCFFFEDNDVDVYSGRRIDLDTWHYACRAAGDVERVICVNRTDEQLTWPDERVLFRDTPLPIKLGGRVAKLVPPWQSSDAAMSLWAFDHDVEWYLFGGAHGVQEPLKFGRPKRQQEVYVPQQGRGALHSTHIASAVLLHRYGVRHGGTDT